MKSRLFGLRRRSLVFLAVIILGTLSMGSSCSDPTGEEKNCPDEDYPLSCPDTGGCCPKGFPIHCGGKCYNTTANARANCSATIDTCERE